MAVNESSARLWHRLGLGPLWRERAMLSSPVLVKESRPPPTQLDWEGLERAVAACTACSLCQSRTQTVFGTGSHGAGWMFIGEAPGAEEDARGEPFVGQAGRLLDNMLAAVGLGRDRPGEQAVFIANVLKCRPPGNRNPDAAEVAACVPFLRRQIALLHPRLIVVLGRFAAQAMLASDASIASLRGRVHQVAVGTECYPVIVTYHPAYLLRNLADKSKVWDDLCLARKTYSRLTTDCATRPSDA